MKRKQRRKMKEKTRKKKENRLERGKLQEGKKCGTKMKVQTSENIQNQDKKNTDQRKEN